MAWAFHPLEMGLILIPDIWGVFLKGHKAARQTIYTIGWANSQASYGTAPLMRKEGKYNYHERP
jgi:hypothetical protein